MAKPKIQISKDSYDVPSMPVKDLVREFAPQFQMRPQVRGQDQGVGNTELVQDTGMSGDTDGKNFDTFNMIHAGAGVPPTPDLPSRTTDVEDGAPATGYSQDPATSGARGSFEGNVANCKNGGPAGTWNFAGSGK